MGNPPQFVEQENKSRTDDEGTGDFPDWRDARMLAHEFQRNNS